MKKRILALTILTAFLLALTGCQCKHEWIDATCTDAKICSQCQETEGEALGHSWMDASCAAPKTCNLCGETEGDALPHTFSGGNYQDPEICEVCGAEGETLTPDFVKYGMEIAVEENVELAYTAHFFWEDDRVDTAKLLVSNYRTFESDETHAPKEGYEWKAVDISIRLDTEMPDTIHTIYAYGVDDYYAIVPYEDNSNYLPEQGWMETVVNFHGEDYPVTVHTPNGNLEASCDYCIFTTQVYVQQPVGYDGMVLWFRDFTIPWAMEQYLNEVVDENTLYFRFD